MLSSRLTALLACAALPGCMMNHDVDERTARAQQAYTAAGARLEAHYTTVHGAADVETAREETDAYVQEMDGFVDDMVEACREMIAAGMVDADDGKRMADQEQAMHDEIDRHQAGMDGLRDLETMRAECDAHHAAMKDMLDDAGATMEHMAGGSCCGGMM